VPSIATCLLLVAGSLDGTAQISLWIAALTIDYLGVLLGHMRGWRVSPAHFVERFGLIIIIALGESIVGIGVGAAGLALDRGVVMAALLGVTVAACLWWSYFDWVVYVAQATLAEATGRDRASFARDAYSYRHLRRGPRSASLAWGLRATPADSAVSLAPAPAAGLCGGVALYFLAHVCLRIR